MVNAESVAENHYSVHCAHFVEVADDESSVGSYDNQQTSDERLDPPQEEALDQVPVLDPVPLAVQDRAFIAFNAPIKTGFPT